MPRRLGWAVVLVLQISACTSAAPAGPPQPVTVTLHDQAGNPVEIFLSTQRMLVFSAQMPMMQQGQQARWVLTGANLANVPGGHLENTAVLPQAGAPALRFTPTNDVDWPSGAYQIDLYVDGVPVAARPFLIAQPQL